MESSVCFIDRAARQNFEARNANGADPKVDPTLTSAWIPRDTWHPVSLPSIPGRNRFRRALSPALAPASGSFRWSVQIRRSFPVPPGGSETDFPGSRLERLHRSGRSLRDASSAKDRVDRPMVVSPAFLSSDPLASGRSLSQSDLEDRADSCRHLGRWGKTSNFQAVRLVRSVASVPFR